jgi:hypothetical protein
VVFLGFLPSLLNSWECCPHLQGSSLKIHQTRGWTVMCPTTLGRMIATCLALPCHSLIVVYQSVVLGEHQHLPPLLESPSLCIPKGQNTVCRCRRCGGTRRQVTRMMPVGVPKVPYRSRKGGGWQWIDLWNCMVLARLMPLPCDSTAVPCTRYDFGQRGIGTNFPRDSSP